MKGTGAAKWSDIYGIILFFTLKESFCLKLHYNKAVVISAAIITQEYIFYSYSYPEGQFIILIILSI